MNLQCSAAQSGAPSQIEGFGRGAGQGRSTRSSIRTGISSRSRPRPAPARSRADPRPRTRSRTSRCWSFMIGTTFYQQRQMQKASPPGAASGQQQAILKFMPILFGIFGYTFPAGLTLYWTTSNVWQIGQQYVLLRAGHIGPDAMDRRIAEQRDQEREQAREAGVHGSDAGARRAGGAGAKWSADQEAHRGEILGRRTRSRPARGRSRRRGSPTPAGRRRAGRRKGGTPKGGTGSRAQHAQAGSDVRTSIRGSAVEEAMARETEKRAASVEEAVEAALHELGVSEQEARIDVIQEPRAGRAGHRLA